MPTEVLEGKTLMDISRQLKNTNKKVQLIYAFNGTGKTRLSRQFKELASGEILYYNAFTEDLFYWDNDLDSNTDHILKIHENSFTSWLMLFLKRQGQDNNIVKNFQNYTNSKITPYFSEDFTSVTFSLATGEENIVNNMKISKGEESNFIWSLFYTFLDEVISILNESPDDRSAIEFDRLEYIVIDDPVTSLDDNHLIEIAVDLAKLIKSSKSNVKFIISTHNPLFHNVFYNTFRRSEQNQHIETYILKKAEDGLLSMRSHVSTEFSYHLYIKEEIEKAVLNNSVKKYHFNFLRNILEKMAVFLGHAKWQDLLPEQYRDSIASYEERMINISSHSDYISDEIVDLNDKATQDLKKILDAINSKYNFKRYQ